MTGYLLLAVDRHSSILKARSSRCYSPYGFDQIQTRESLLGFNGEERDIASEYDLLGNGTRAFNPILMRFGMPDKLSPFGKGGTNSYAYCSGDPINFTDPSGLVRTAWHSSQPMGVSHGFRTIMKNKYSIIRRAEMRHERYMSLPGADGAEGLTHLEKKAALIIQGISFGHGEIVEYTKVSRELYPDRTSGFHERKAQEYAGFATKVSEAERRAVPVVKPLEPASVRNPDAAAVVVDDAGPSWRGTRR